MPARVLASCRYHCVETPARLGAIGPDPSCGTGPGMQKALEETNASFIILITSRTDPYWYWPVVPEEE